MSKEEVKIIGEYGGLTDQQVDEQIAEARKIAAQAREVMMKQGQEIIAQAQESGKITNPNYLFFLLSREYAMASYALLRLLSPDLFKDNLERVMEIYTGTKPAADKSSIVKGPWDA